jgi:deoxyribonuclease-4
MVRIGAHVEQDDPVGAALAIGGEAAQFFLGDPQSWKTPSVAFPGGPQALRDAAKSAGVTLFVHAPYVINVASTNNRIRIPSRKLLQQTIDLAAEIDAAAVVVHGGHVTASDDPQAGFDNWRKAAERLEARCPVLIENTAGGAHAMARTREAIGRLWDAIGDTGIGFCLDTCHAFAGGHHLPEVVDAIRAVTGRIDLVHANDSQGGFDSGRDRHTRLGTGEIDAAALVATIAAAGATAVCETPDATLAEDVTWLRERIS